MALAYRVFQKSGRKFKATYLKMATCYNYTKDYKWFNELSRNNLKLSATPFRVVRVTFMGGSQLQRYSDFKLDSSC